MTFRSNNLILSGCHMVWRCFIAVALTLIPGRLLSQVYPDRAAHQESQTTLPNGPWNPRAVPSDSSVPLGTTSKGVSVYAPELNVPSEAHASYLLGIRLLREKKPNEAESVFRKAIQLFPKYSSAFNGLGVALRDQNRLVDAHAAFDQSLRLDPANSFAQKNLAALFLATGKLVEAEKLLRSATTLTPHEPETLLMLAYVELTLKRYEAALATTDLIDHKDRDRLPVVRMIRGEALESMGNLKEAARQYEAYLKTHPDDAHASFARDALQRTKRPDH